MDKLGKRIVAFWLFVFWVCGIPYVALTREGQVTDTNTWIAMIVVGPIIGIGFTYLYLTELRRP